MSKSRDRRRRWQRREAKGMNHPFTRALHKVGWAAVRAGREFERLNLALRVDSRSQV